MSERMTSVRLRSQAHGTGWAEWGRKSRPQMIAILRAKAERDKARAEAILAATDEEFIVETYLGPIAERNREEVTE